MTNKEKAGVLRRAATVLTTMPEQSMRMNDLFSELIGIANRLDPPMTPGRAAFLAFLSTNASMSHNTEADWERQGQNYRDAWEAAAQAARAVRP